jgi:hypothetical protein
MSGYRDRETYEWRMAEPPRAKKRNKRHPVLKGLLSGIAAGLIVVIGLHMTLPAKSGAVIKPTVVRTVPIAPPRH